MSFCCGASMIGTKGTLKHIRTRIHNVPILLCPVCSRVDVHYLAWQEYEILAEYAHGDGALDVDFEDYTEMLPPDLLYANCVSNEETESPQDVVRGQIDNALDLLVLSARTGDAEWSEQLRRRLKILGQRAARLQKKAGRAE
ncbi:hypothetical protein [Gorillibacterium sp. sgz5001074]|uniref:hypothetical protein n=1 Tax=Gorillibacterium sp. sgz5001074 TaxID=3446695 RepID=UPI003F673479